VKAEEEQEQEQEERGRRRTRRRRRRRRRKKTKEEEEVEHEEETAVSLDKRCCAVAVSRGREATVELQQRGCTIWSHEDGMRVYQKAS
jgi:hypothetical protein